MPNFHNLPHHNQALDNTKIKRFLDYWVEEDQKAIAYAAFWVVMEMLHRNKNKLPIKFELMAEYFDNYSRDLFPIQFIDVVIKKMLEAELLLTEEDYFFSPYQKLVKDNKIKHEENLQAKNQKLNNIVGEQEKLIRRLNDKINFLKSNKKQLRQNFTKG